MAAGVGSDVEALCSKCGDVWHVVVAKVGERIAKVQCKQCGGYHRYKSPHSAPATAKLPATNRPPKEPREPRSPVERFEKPAVAADLSKPSRPYRASDRFDVGERIDHVSFGQGIIELSEPGKVTVFFATGRRVLVQAKDLSATEPLGRPKPFDHSSPPAAANPSATPDGSATVRGVARTRLGWLGPAILIVGVAIAGVGIWYAATRKPQLGAVIDTIAIDRTSSFVVRAEETGERNFVELVRDGSTVWRALVPPYAGRAGAPGIAWSKIAVSVRVIRHGRAEIFALSMRDASKLGGFRLAPTHGAIQKQAIGPVTLTDHVRSYELVSGDGWNELVAFELDSGDALWKQQLGPGLFDRGGVEGGVVWLAQGASRVAFAVASGTPQQ